MCVGCVGRFVGIWPVAARREGRSDMTIPEPVGVEDSANERHYVAGNSHVYPKLQNVGKKPQMLPSFEQKNTGKLTVYGQSLCLQIL
jgi:hypothetical protein